MKAEVFKAPQQTDPPLCILPVSEVLRFE